MADKFTSESSYADKRMAMEYAADDETIRYVSDKYATAIFLGLQDIGVTK